MKNNQHPSKKEPTLADVARIAGVSGKTVSRVINRNDYVSEETINRVEAAIQQIGYRPNRAARSLVSKQSAVIGVVIPSITNPFYPDVVSGIEQTALEQDYNILMFNTLRDQRREREAFRFLEENRVDGVIFQCPSEMPTAELEQTLKRQKNAVVLGSFPLSVPTGIVRLNVRGAMMEAVEHLVQNDRRNIAFIGNDDNNYAASERITGLQQAAEKFDISIQFVFVESNRDSNAVQAGYEATRNFLHDQPDINGLICFHDLFAYGALDACDEMGINVPDQIAVIGMDNIAFSGLKRISLTTLHVPKFDIGVKATNLLFQLINGEDTETEIVLDTKLLIRGSTQHSR